MNSDTPPPDDFERQLGDFAPTPLPEAWKIELIANAVSAPPSNVKTVAFSLFQKISLSGIAAAWVAIAVLRMTMPTAESDTGVDVVDSQEEATPADVPLLARYIEQRNALTQQF